MAQPFVLASGSPRRRELLLRAGYEFVVRPADADESGASGDPAEIVTELALRKARAADVAPSELALAADTLVALDASVLGKPRDEADARRMLRALSGRAHAVYTGLCARRGARIVRAYEKTLVVFRALTDTEIDRYIATGEPMDKAGAYGIQGGAGAFVARLDGPYDNVMGLPVALAGKLLTELRYGV